MSSEDFKSLIVTDPDLIDEGIDVSDLRTQTDTNPRLLGAIEGYPGISYDPTSYSYLSDLNRLFASGLPTIDTSQPTIPAPPSGGGGGGGGGGTSPGTGGTTPTQPDSIGGFDPGVTPGPSGFIGLDPEYDVSPFEYDDAQTYEPPTTPQTRFLPSGAAGGASLANLDLDNIDLGNPTGDLRIVSEEQGLTGTPKTTFGTAVDVEQGFTQDFSAQGTLSDPLEKIDFVSGADVNNPKGFLDKLGLKGFNAEEALIKTAINAAVGKPVTLFLDILKDLMPPMDPRQKALNEMYDVKSGTIQSGLMKGYNPVSGGALYTLSGGKLGEEPTYGLQEAYDKRIDKVTDTLKDKYNFTNKEIDQIKTGNITKDIIAKGYSETMGTTTNNIQKLADLVSEKEKEKKRLDLFSGDIDERDQMLEDLSTGSKVNPFEETANAGKKITTGVNPFKDIDTGVGEFGGTPITTNITSDQIDEFDTTPTINLGPRKLDQDLSTLGDDLSAELDNILGNNITGDSTLVAGSVKENIKNDYQNKLDTLNSLKEKDLDLGLPPGQYDDAIKELEDAIEKINQDLKLEEIKNQKVELITMNDATTGDDKPQDPGPSGFVGLDKDMDVSPFEFDDYGTYDPPAPKDTPNTPTSTYDAEAEDDQYETPSQPDYSNVSTGGPPSQGGGGGGPPSRGGGCCFIMLESRYGDGTMDKVVRRYRDEKMTPRNRRGYYKVARVLVPLMRKSKVFKWIVAKTFADPLVSYGKWYYGENKHGWIFAPIKTAWLKIFDVVGTDTVFIRENGEEV